jgi:hypothetical protein
MKMYLSAYELGNETEKLKALIPENNKVGYIFNALDFTGTDPERKAKRVKKNMDELNELGFDCVDLDLKKYYGKASELKKLVGAFGTIWVSGGNTLTPKTGTPELDNYLVNQLVATKVVSSLSHSLSPCATGSTIATLLPWSLVLLVAGFVQRI